MSGWGDEADLFGPVPAGATRDGVRPGHVAWRVGVGVLAPAAVLAGIAMLHLPRSVGQLPLLAVAVLALAVAAVGFWATRRWGVCTAVGWVAVVAAGCAPAVTWTAVPVLLAALGFAGLARHGGSR